MYPSKSWVDTEVAEQGLGHGLGAKDAPVVTMPLPTVSIPPEFELELLGGVWSHRLLVALKDAPAPSA